MPASLVIGPLALPWSLLLVVAAWWLGSWVQERWAKRQGQAIGPHGWRMALAILVAARLGFVLQYWPDYAAAPWSALDIRDGGYAPLWGVLVPLPYLGWLFWRRSPWLHSVSIGSACGLGVWLAGQATLLALPGAHPPPLPPWQGVTLDARQLALSSLQGQPVVLNLWASWCPPCRREMPALLHAQQQHPQVQFLWINQGEAPEVVQRFAAQHGLPSADVMLDTASQLGQNLGYKALPTTLFFNAKGDMVALRSGELSRATLTHYLAKIETP